MTKVLFGYSDTEGTPHVKSNDSELWNMAIMFKHVIEPTTTKDIFHVAHLSINKNAKKKHVNQSLVTHFSSIEFLRKLYDCDRVCIAFWGAPHDMAVLNSYSHGYEFESLDLLPIARRLNPDIDSFNIGKLCDRFGVECPISKVHTGLGDVLRMVDLLPKLKMGSPICFYNVESKISSSTKPKPKHETKTTPIRCRPKTKQKLQGGGSRGGSYAAAATALRSTALRTNASGDIAALAIKLAKTKI